MLPAMGFAMELNAPVSNTIRTSVATTLIPDGSYTENSCVARIVTVEIETINGASSCRKVTRISAPSSAACCCTDVSMRRSDNPMTHAGTAHNHAASVQMQRRMSDRLPGKNVI